MNVKNWKFQIIFFVVISWGYAVEKDGVHVHVEPVSHCVLRVSKEGKEGLWYQVNWTWQNLFLYFF